jgi:hypothetical protein
MDATDTTPEPTFANPPRWWWTKRLAVGLGASFVLVTMLFCWWRFEAHRRLLAEVEIARAASQRVIDKSKPSHPVANEPNARISLSAAATQLALPTKDLDFINAFDPAQPIDAATKASLDRVVQASRASLDLARQARSQPSNDWTGVQNPLSQYRSHVTLMMVLRARMLLEHLAGDDSQAIETARDLLAATEVWATGPTELTHYFGGNMSDTFLREIGRVAIDLRILESRSATSLPSGAASRSQVEALLHELTSEEAFMGAFELSQNQRRIEVINAITSANGNPLGKSPLPWLLARPIVELDLIRLLHDYDQIVPNTRASSYPAMVQNVRMMTGSLREGAGHESSNVARLVHLLYDRSIYSRIIIAHFRALTVRRGTAIQLAIRLYAIDHEGKLPDALGDLVPTCLPVVPGDPFSKDRPFGYRRDDQPLVYSVGEDELDQGGVFPRPVPRPTRIGATTQFTHPSPWGTRDELFPLFK